MQPALQRLLASPSAIAVLRRIIESPVDSFGCPQAYFSQVCNHGVEATGSHRSSPKALVKDHSGAKHRFSAGRETRNLLARHRNERWRKHLITFEQYQYESDLPHSSGLRIIRPRLVDHLEYGSDWELWLELVRFRQRHHGSEGLRSIWKAILRRGLQLPCHGLIADELWEGFLLLGFEDPGILKEIELYARNQRASAGVQWPNLYSKIVGYHLKAKPHHALVWHMYLHEPFPPSLEQLRKLFQHAVLHAHTLEIFRRIYLKLGMRGMYDTVIPQLCARENYAAATRWHSLLMLNKDLPLSSSTSEPLLQHMAIYGNRERLIDITKGMVDAGIPFAKSTSKASIPLKDPTLVSPEIINRQLGETHGIRPKIFSDQFCARLFATKMFSSDSVIKGLRILGVEAIGHLSLRELGLREGCEPQAICTSMDHLSEAGISINTSTFTTVVRRLALENKGQLLEDVLRCDLHPETFDDWNLQEALLASYHQRGDQRQIDRTLAILTTNSPYKYLAVDRWNLLLRSYMIRRDLEAVRQTVEAMQELQLPISSRSSGYVRIAMLSRRQVGRRPYRTDELPLVSNIWRGILILGGHVPPIAWREIFRRLGMTGQLQNLESLALWLAHWYSDPKAQVLQGGLALPAKELSRQLVPHIPANLLTDHPRHPLRILFPKATQQAFIAWGFQHGAETRSNRALAPTNSNDTQMPWIWGITLLRKLQQRRVAIAPATVAKACRQHLIILFSPRVSTSRTINRRVRASNLHKLGHYVEEIQRIWGPSVFDRVTQLPGSSMHSLHSWITTRALKSRARLGSDISHEENDLVRSTMARSLQRRKFRFQRSGERGKLGVYMMHFPREPRKPQRALVTQRFHVKSYNYVGRDSQSV